MANHKSALKSIRQTEKRRVQNKYFSKTMRNAVKKFRSLTDGTTAKEDLPKLSSLIDKLAKNKMIHKNKASNLKSKLARKVNVLGK